MQENYASDENNPWHLIRPRGGLTQSPYNDPGDHAQPNFMFFGRGGQARWGQQCGVALAACAFLGMMEGSSSDTFVDDFLKHFENGRYPTEWSKDIWQTYSQGGWRGQDYGAWGEKVAAWSFSRNSLMCHGIIENSAKFINTNYPGQGLTRSAICAEASIMAVVEFVFRYLNNKRAQGPAVPSLLAGFQTTVGATCTQAGCHSGISGYAKSNCRTCHK